MSRRPVIAVFGGGLLTVAPGSREYALASELGALIAQAGAVLLCGGGTGAMEAAAQGAVDHGGWTIGIFKDSDGTPPPQIKTAIWTGMGDGRNFLNAALADVAIAVDGEAGTLSEIALALKVKTPVVAFPRWRRLLSIPGFETSVDIVDTPEEAVDRVYRRMGIARGQRLQNRARSVHVPDQAANIKAFQDTLLRLQ